MLSKRLGSISAFFVTIFLLCFGHSAFAAETAILFSTGYKLDKSFNESAFRAVLRLQQKGYNITEYKPKDYQERISMLQQAASSSEHVIVFGFVYSKILQDIAPLYPNTHFSIIDSKIKGPNIQSLTFREEEGAFLAGVAASASSYHNVVGFIGGMYSPLVMRFQAGYEQGAHYHNPSTKVISRYIGNDVKSFSDPMSGYLLAQIEINQGADVIFAAAGGSGVGAYQAAEENIVFAIGVDADQNHLFPSTMLTSLIKDIGKIIENAAISYQKGKWKAQSLSFGLKEGAFHLSINKHNKPHFSPKAIQAVNKAKEDIMAGRIKVNAVPELPSLIGIPELK